MFGPKVIIDALDEDLMEAKIYKETIIRKEYELFQLNLNEENNEEVLKLLLKSYEKYNFT